MLELEAKKTVYSTYHISYETKDKRKCKYVDVTDLLQWFQSQDIEFKESTGVLLMDEAYTGTDSRTSSSITNRLLSHFVFQSRKLGLDLFAACQLASSIDLRIRRLIDRVILAEIDWRDILDSQGNVIESIKDFKYTWADATGNSGEYYLTNEQAQEVWKYYSTMEIVQPPMMLLDKKVGKEVREQGIQKGIEMRKREPSEIKAPTEKNPIKKGRKKHP